MTSASIAEEPDSAPLATNDIDIEEIEDRLDMLEETIKSVLSESDLTMLQIVSDHLSSVLTFILQ